MLQIDLKPSRAVVQGMSTIQSKSQKTLRPVSAKTARSRFIRQPSATLNSYTSLNRANRIRSLARIIDENKILLNKLQVVKSTFNSTKLENDFQKQRRL